MGRSLVAVSALMVCLLRIQLVPAAEDPLDFAHDVLPILKTHCASCHTNGTYKGDLSLDTRDAIVSAAVVTPGKSKDSELIRRLTSQDVDERMPKGKPPLRETEVATLKAWVDQGLPWEDGFSFREASTVRQLTLSPPDLPADDSYGSHPIDRIIAAYWREAGVEYPRPAANHVFLRRLHLDVAGLLPTPDEVGSYVADQSDDRRVRRVRALLSDKRSYAEHWLTFWNDLLRNDYVGTGYIDGGRKQITNWLYESLLANKPYDAFVRELINPSNEAEGFIRGIKWRGRVNASQVRELQFAQNISQVFLGLNMKCASCHDSFIDDWELKDAYGLAAIIAENPLEIHRCDKPTGEIAVARFLYPELGTIDGELDRSGRLEQLANLMTKPENGRLARTIVNRIWQRLMGRGIVHPVDVMANPAYSEELLEYLAAHLVDHDFDIKQTIELITTSNVYAAQTSAADPADGGKSFVFRGPSVKRMTAEQYMDAVWRVTETSPESAAFDTGDRQGRPVRASLVVADSLMRTLGRPNREQVVTTRPETLTTLQALELTNGEAMTMLLAQGSANLGKRFADRSVADLVSSTYTTALCRPPTTDELDVAQSILGEALTEEGTADYLWTILMLPEFQLIR